MKARIKITALILSVCLLLGAVGCGSAPEGQQVDGEQWIKLFSDIENADSYRLTAHTVTQSFGQREVGDGAPEGYIDYNCVTDVDYKNGVCFCSTKMYDFNSDGTRKDGIDFDQYILCTLSDMDIFTKRAEHKGATDSPFGPWEHRGENRYSPEPHKKDMFRTYAGATLMTEYIMAASADAEQKSIKDSYSLFAFDEQSRSYIAQNICVKTSAGGKLLDSCEVMVTIKNDAVAFVRLRLKKYNDTDYYIDAQMTFTEHNKLTVSVPDELKGTFAGFKT